MLKDRKRVGWTVKILIATQDKIFKIFILNFPNVPNNFSFGSVEYPVRHYCGCVKRKCSLITLVPNKYLSSIIVFENWFGNPNSDCERPLNGASQNKKNEPGNTAPPSEPRFWSSITVQHCAHRSLWLLTFKQAYNGYHNYLLK